MEVGHKQNQAASCERQESAMLSQYFESKTSMLICPVKYPKKLRSEASFACIGVTEGCRAHQSRLWKLPCGYVVVFFGWYMYPLLPFSRGLFCLTSRLALCSGTVVML